jgi:GTPase SAR1 family protein
MGGLIGNSNKWFKNREMRCLMLGLDAAGKTTLLSKVSKHVTTDSRRSSPRASE